MDADRDLSPEEAFALLGNETRIGIVLALWEADDPLPFSELRERVGVRDSGQFNYHLSKLVGRFVRQRDGGYELPFAGFRVIGAILSGTYTHRASLDPFELDSTCSRCDSPLEARYRDEQVVIRCPDCDRRVSRFGFPPGAFENRSVTDLPRTFDRWLRNVFSMMADGICLNCTGRTVGSLVTDSEHLDEAVGIEFVCERCDDYATSSVGSYLLFHPAVVSFHYERGVNLREERSWDFQWLYGTTPEIPSDDPLRVSYVVSLDGDELELRVDEALSITVVEGDVRTEDV